MRGDRSRPIFNRSWTALLAGDLDTALNMAEESVELTSGVDNGLIPAATGLALAAARLEALTDDLRAAPDDRDHVLLQARLPQGPPEGRQRVHQAE